MSNVFNGMEALLGDGTYESPIATDFIFKDPEGLFRILRSGHVFNWTGPGISKPAVDNVVLAGYENGTTLWVTIDSLIPKDLGMIGV